MFISSLIQPVTWDTKCGWYNLIWNNYIGICNKDYFEILNQRADIFAIQPSWAKLSPSPTIHYKMHHHNIQCSGNLN